MRGYLGNKHSDLPASHQADDKDLPTIDVGASREVARERREQQRDEQRQRDRETRHAIEERAREDAKLAARRSASPMYRDV